MKKILLGFALEQRPATCNFCGEVHEDCIKGSVPLSVQHREFKVEHMRVPASGTLEHGQRLDDYEYKGLFAHKVVTATSYGYFTKDYKYADVVIDSRTAQVSAHADICPNCIKQLAKLIK